MLKTSKLLSLLLVAALLLSVFSGVIVTAGAESVEAATIVYDGTTIQAHVGDTITYRTYMDVTGIPTAENGRVHVVDGVVRFDSDKLTMVSDPQNDWNNGVFDTPFSDVMYGTDVPGEIHYNDTNQGRGFLFNADSDPMIEVSFEITAAGTATIGNELKTLTRYEDSTPLLYIKEYEKNAELVPENQPAYRSELDVNCPHTIEPTEPASADKLTVTIHGLFGQSETKSFNVGDEFAVYTILNTSEISGGKIGSINATQHYTNANLQLMDAYDPEEGDIEDTEGMFPITKTNTTANGMWTVSREDPTLGAIYYNASIASTSSSKAFMFVDNESILILSHYKATAAGEGHVYNSFTTLAVADQALTRIVDKKEIVNDNFNCDAHFSLEPEPTEAEPTEPAPTEPEPTEPAPTEPAPTEPAPTEPAPTEPAPTEPAPATEPAPTEPAPATEPAPSDELVVTIHGLFGQSETKTFNIGDEFAVYTILNTSEISGGKIGSLNATQHYTNANLQLMDAYDPEEGDIEDTEGMFPITKDNTTANGMWTVSREDPTLGAIYYNASIASTSSSKAFMFVDNESILILSHYKAVAGGEGHVYNSFTTLAVADQALTRIVDRKEIVNDNFNCDAHFELVPQPTEAEPTEPAPTEPAPTEPAPTEPAPVTEPAPTEPAPQTAVVTIYGLDGQSETKEFNIGDTFYVYTTMSAADPYGNSNIASVNGTQTFTDSILSLISPVDSENIFTDNASVFPILGDAAIGRLTDPGKIAYNASTPGVGDGFRFDSDNDQLIVTQYQVVAGGEAEVRNALITVASADEDLTKIVDQGEVTGDSELNMAASFTEPEPDPTEPAPTEPAPTEPAPTEPAPTEPAPTEPAPTEPAPTEPAPTEPAPTEPAPTEPVTGTAIVTIYGLDGESETKEFNVGDIFTVYTTLNTAELGQVGSLNGTQTYTDSILSLADALEEDGSFTNASDVFPVTSDGTVANGKIDGTIYFNASKPSTSGEAYEFDSNNSLLIKTTYTVTAPGEAEVRTNMRTLALADDDLTRIIDKGEIVNDNFRLHASYTWPEPAPTEPAPTEPAPTEPAPTEPAPTEPAPTEPAPTEPAPQTAVVNIYDIYGNLCESKEFNIGDTFTTYTIFNAKDINDGKIASLSGNQTYTDSVVALADTLTSEGAIEDTDTVFPITKGNSLGNAGTSGIIYFNATTPSTDAPFVFDSDDDVVIATTYTVTAGGVADIKTTLDTVAAADDDLTPIILRGDVADDNFNEFMTFELPEPAPTEPAPTEPAPTEPAPTEPAPTEPAPTEPAPTEPAPQTAIVNIYDIYGNLCESKEFNIGDTFTTYTIFNAKDINDGKIAALSGEQTYTDSVVALADILTVEGAIADTDTVFPITKGNSLGNAGTSGIIYFNATTPSTDDPFIFDSDDDVVIATTYTVTAGGVADIKTTLKTVAAADDDLTPIILREDVADDNFNEFMTFELPEPAPTEPAPTEPAPTEPAPTEPAPTEPAPTEPAPTEPAPTEPAPTEPGKAVITIYGFNGQSETKEFNVGDTFTVYTYLNASNVAENGRISSVNGSQTYSDSILDYVPDDASTMFPILGNSAVYNDTQSGKILYNASTPDLDNAFKFNSDDDIMIATTYTVTAPGEGEVRNAIQTLAAADEDLTPIIKVGEPVDPTKEIDVEASFTEREVTPDPTQPAPTEPAPTEPAPTEPAPTEPAPTEPAPTEPAPTEPAPTEPAPTEPAPTEPAPTEPAPTEPAPTEPAPTEPAPTEPAPTEPAPTEPAPTEPAPIGDFVYINADGNIYKVAPGSDHTYTYYLKNDGTICGVDASTTWDAPVISVTSPYSFPVLGDVADLNDPENGGNVVLKDYDIVDGDGNLVQQQVVFNYTNAEGVDFDTDKSELITFTIHVAEDAVPGTTYYITTNIKTLEGEEEEKLIFEDTDINPPEYREGMLDGEPGEKEDIKYTADEQTYVLGSLEEKTFTANADKSDNLTYGKFRALYIDLTGDGTYTLVDYSNYTKAEGSLLLTLDPSYMETLEVGDYNLKFVFSDGEAIGVLHVVAAEVPTTPATEPATTPASPTSGDKSSTNDSKTSTNGSAVQTGSPEVATVFVMILVMAAGIILFTKKRRKED